MPDATAAVLQPTGVTCRESELTPGEAHAAYLELNGQITVHLDAYVEKMVDATEEFKTLKGSRAPPAYEILAAPRPARATWELLKI